MPPNRKPTPAEHSAATRVVWTAGAIAAGATVGAVLRGATLIRHDGFSFLDHATFLDWACGMVVMVLVGAVVLGTIMLILGAIIAAWEWTAWACKTEPAREPDGFGGEDLP